MVRTQTEESFKRIGTSIIDRTDPSEVDINKKDNVECFRSIFGTSPKVCETIWYRLSPEETMEAGSSPIHMLWALMLMKVYANENVLRSMAATPKPTAKTWRKWAWYFVFEISYLEASIVSIHQYKLINRNTLFFLTLCKDFV